MAIDFHRYFPVPEVVEFDEPDIEPPLDEEVELEELRSSVLPFCDGSSII